MSLTVQEEIKCPCGEIFQAEIIQSVSVYRNPEYRESILCGDLNIVRCPACKKYLYAEKFLLYHDQEREILAFVYPKDMAEQQEQVQENLKKNDTVIQELIQEEKLHYRPFILFGMDALCTLVRMDEEIGIESEIIENLAPALGLYIKRLKLDASRRLQSLPILPLSPRVPEELQSASESEQFKGRILAGLDKLFKENNHLIHTKTFYQTLKNQTDWKIQSTDILES